MSRFPKPPPWMLEGPLGRSTERYAADTDYDYESAASIQLDAFIRDAPLGEYPAANAEVALAMRQVLQLTTVRAMQNVYWGISHAIEQFCKSPAEAMLILGLVSVGVEETIIRGWKDTESIVVPLWFTSRDAMTITPKTDLEGYRAAFVVEHVSEVPDFDHKVKAKDGTEIPSSKRQMHRVLVECEDAENQRYPELNQKQDALMKGLGFDVFRFSETEIRNDPIKCALEILEHLRAWD